MRTYKLYEHTTGDKIITIDGIESYFMGVNQKLRGYKKLSCRCYLEGDLATDQGYKLIGRLTESEFFAELL